VIRTLLDRCENIVTEEEDRKNEVEHVKEALSVCGYPEWSFKLVEKQMKAENIKKKTSRHTESGGNRDVQVVIPYVKGLSEACARIYRKYGAKTAMRPYQTIRSYVVHPKDKLEKEEISECVYCIPCKGCEKVYVGETGRNFGVRMSEHRKEVERNEETRYTRSQKQTAEITTSKSAITDHARRENHVIDWEDSRVLTTENDRHARWIREAVAIRRTGSRAMNRDVGTYNLSHTYDSLLLSAVPRFTSGSAKSTSMVRRRQQSLPKRHN
jgi:hypothetical protein